jgi:rod shape determining protein RodA
MRGSGRFLNNKMKIDWLFLALVLVLTSIGIMLVYSATANSTVPWYSSYWFRQIVYFGVGSLIAVVFAVIRIDYWQRFAFPLYFATILLLAIVAFGGGDAAKGAGRWLNLGFVRIQPSEFAKITFLLAISK